VVAWLAGGDQRKQALSKWGPITHWNTTDVRNISHLFRGASSFDETLAWDTRNVYNMEGVFSGASAFNNGGKPLHWDVSYVEFAHDMFKGASAFEQTLVWDLRRAKGVENMFDKDRSSGKFADIAGLYSVWDACYAVDLFEHMDKSLIEDNSLFTDKNDLIRPLLKAHPSIRLLYSEGGDVYWLFTRLQCKARWQLHDFYVDAINKVRTYVADAANDATSTCRKRALQLADALLDKLMQPGSLLAKHCESRSLLVKHRESRSPCRQRPTP
jgi:hypothetical protein